jgi:formylmethanofuran dehydrogenase subunit E
MLNIAKTELDINKDENVYVTSETFNCVPDPFKFCGDPLLAVKD